MKPIAVELSWEESELAGTWPLSAHSVTVCNEVGSRTLRRVIMTIVRLYL